MDSSTFRPKNFASILLKLRAIVAKDFGKKMQIRLDLIDSFEEQSLDPIQLYSTVRGAEEMFSTTEELRQSWDDLLEFCCA